MIKINTAEAEISTFLIPHIFFPFQTWRLHYQCCNLAKRIDASFIAYAVVLHKTCKQTLRCKIGEVTI